MKITYKGDYALKTILMLSLHYGQGVVTIHGLAQEADIPIKFLEQVLLDLKRGGFVESKRGINGGYYLTRMPRQITIGEVVRFIDGPIEPVPCAMKDALYKGCKDIYTCVFKNIWMEVTKSISDIIDHVNFEELCKKIQIKEEAMVYQI